MKEEPPSAIRASQSLLDHARRRRPQALLARARSLPRAARWSLPSLLLAFGLSAVLWRVSQPAHPNDSRVPDGSGESRDDASPLHGEPQEAEERAPEITSPTGSNPPVPPIPLPKDSLAALVEAADAAYRRGAWTSPPRDNVAHYLNRILARNPTHEPALALRDSLTGDFEKLIQAALSTGNADRAREIVQRCLEAVPEAAPCRKAVQ